MAAKTKAKKRTKTKMIAKTAAARKKTGKPKAVKKRKAVAKAVPKKKKRTAASTGVSSKQARARSGRQAGDLEGLSRVASADSESTAELLEEGNAFEAGIVAGVEAADADEGEVRTHEVPEDDVPEEYLDKD